MDNSLFEGRPTRAIVRLKSLENNFNVLREIVGEKKIMGIVKADAYGHGLVPISKKLQDLGVEYLGTAYLEEAEILRESGIHIPILVLGAVHHKQIERYIINDIELTGSSIEKIKQIGEMAKKLNKEARVHLKIDTGMGRIGVQWNRVDRFFEELFNLDTLSNINIVGVYTHFSSADTDKEYTELQYERFQKVLKKLSKYVDIDDLLIHMANTTTVCDYPKEFLKDMVRTGLILYGYSSNPEVQKRLKPVMTFKTIVSYFKVLKKGSPVGYKQQYITKKQTRIVTLPMGYADGYPIEFSNNSFVYLNSKRYPIVGRLCMDQCMVDIRDGEAYVGDEVELFGKNISLWELTKNSDKSPYTILTGISQRVPRIYI